MIVSTALEGSNVMKDPNNDPFGVEELLSNFLLTHGVAGKGKRIAGDAYEGPSYSLPYRGPVHLGNFGFDVGNVFLQCYLIVRNYTTNRIIKGMDLAVEEFARTLHPDKCFFAKWGNRR